MVSFEAYVVAQIILFLVSSSSVNYDRWFVRVSSHLFIQSVCHSCDYVDHYLGTSIFKTLLTDSLKIMTLIYQIPYASRTKIWLGSLSLLMVMLCNPKLQLQSLFICFYAITYVEEEMVMTQHFRRWKDLHHDHYPK